MRIIDADALIDRLDYCVKEGMGSTIAFTFKHMVEEAPGIEIVRCRECKHSDGEPIADGRLWCNSHGCYMRFCSYGEREGE